METIHKVVWLNPQGICSACGRVGAYQRQHDLRCEFCISYELAVLIEAVRETLDEYSEWNLDGSPIRRLESAAEALEIHADTYLEDWG